MCARLAFQIILLLTYLWLPIHCHFQRKPGFKLVPPEPLLRTNTATLPIRPHHLELFGDSLLVAGFTNSTSTLIILDAKSLKVTKSLDIKLRIQEVAVADNGSVIYVLGDTGNKSYFATYSKNLKQLSFKKIKGLSKGNFISPKMSVTSNKKLIIGSLNNPIVMINVSNPGKPIVNPLKGRIFRSSPASEAWMSEKDKLLFFNMAFASGLVAVNSKTYRKLSELRTGYSKLSRTRSRSYSVHAILRDRPCSSFSNNSFLFANKATNTMGFVEYDLRFRALRLRSRIDTSVFRQFGNDTQQIASSCNMAVNWLGNEGAQLISQYNLKHHFTCSDFGENGSR